MRRPSPPRPCSTSPAILVIALHGQIITGLSGKPYATRHKFILELARILAASQKEAEAARLTADESATEAMSADELERLRALGYIQ